MKVACETSVQNGIANPCQGTATVSEQSLQEWRSFSDADALSFCDRHGLSTLVGDCLSIAHKTMCIAGQPTVLLVTDEEVGDASLMICVTVTGDAETASTAYERFLKEWVADTGAERIPISLSYTIA